MENPFEKYKETDTTRLLQKLSLLWYLTFLPNFGGPKTDLNLSPLFKKIYDACTKVVYVIFVIHMFLSVGAFWSQSELTQKQKCLRNFGSVSSPCALFYAVNYSYYRTEVNELLHNLAVALKKEYNDKETEKAMIFRIKMLLGSYFWLGLINTTWMGIYAVYEIYFNEGVFVTYIPVWPDVADPTTTALIARVVFYLVWLTVFWLTVGTTGLIITILIALNHQFMNLQSYFHTIGDIFCDSSSSQTEKEMKYETGFIKGIRLHVLTLRCVRDCQHTCGMVFNVHLVMVPTLLISIMPDMILIAESDWNKAISQLSLLIVLLLLLGYYMWNAGDITVEASKLPDAMYASGWQNCCGRSSVRVRKLVVIAITQASRPVEMKAFGFLIFSYESYVRIVKTTYSVFTVFS